MSTHRALCLNHHPPRELALPSLDPTDIARVFHNHDLTDHHPHGWLIGGPGGATGDICAPCGGGNRDGTALAGGPRHDLCLKGKSRGRGRDCGCTHTKPHMKGIKP